MGLYPLGVECDGRTARLIDLSTFTTQIQPCPSHLGTERAQLYNINFASISVTLHFEPFWFWLIWDILGSLRHGFKRFQIDSQCFTENTRIPLHITRSKILEKTKITHFHIWESHLKNRQERNQDRIRAFQSSIDFLSDIADADVCITH